MAAVTQPLARPRLSTRSRTRKARARGGIMWIAIGGILLAGVVFVNVAVLRLNLGLDGANSERVKLRAENAALQSQLASALGSQRIQAQAHSQDGLVQSTSPRYVNIGK